MNTFYHPKYICFLYTFYCLDCVYDPSMRIIMSAIAFLELPDIIVELHKMLPPIIKFPVPPKRSKLKIY